MNKQVYLLSPHKRKNDYHFYFEWFTSAWIESGGKIINNYNLPWIFRLLIAKLRLSFAMPIFKSRNKAIITLCGGYPDSFIWPFSYYYETIPVIWDSWPKYWKRLSRSIKRNKIKVVFFTASQTAEKIESLIPGVKCFHLPEGINISSYNKGINLEDRSIDLLELGRVMSRFHDQIQITKIPSLKTHIYRSPEDRLLFADHNTLVAGLSDSKVTVCFPRCDSHPEITGEVETLTQRYWECMLSRTLIIGRAPKELIDFIGYNPVIVVDWGNINMQLDELLKNISKYQNVVDNNYKTAIQMSSWDNRIIYIKSTLTSLGYKFV